MGDPLLECFSSGIPSIVCRGGGVSEQQKQPPEGGCRREQATRSAGGLDSICQNAAGDAAEPAPSFSGLSLKSIWVQIHRSSGRTSFPGKCRSQSFFHAEDLVIDAEIGKKVACGPVPVLQVEAPPSFALRVVGRRFVGHFKVDHLLCSGYSDLRVRIAIFP